MLSNVNTVTETTCEYGILLLQEECHIWKMFMHAHEKTDFSNVIKHSVLGNDKKTKLLQLASSSLEKNELEKMLGEILPEARLKKALEVTDEQQKIEILANYFNEGYQISPAHMSRYCGARKLL